jgi:outer membrane receptor protein involved in Fe transport
MKLTTKHLGLLSVLLLGVTHADTPAEGSVLAVLADASSAAQTGESITTPTHKEASAEIVTGVVVNQPTHSEELNASLTEISKALKDGFQAVAVVASGLVDAAGSGLFIAKGVVNLTVSVAKVTWFTAKALYIAVNAAIEFSQTTYASK